MTVITLPPGKYFIGDPCYPFDKSWDDVLTETGFFSKKIQTVRGIPVFGARTTHGDGCFIGSDGNEYGVDAGLIGAIPVELIERDVTDMGRIVDAPKGLECYSDNGYFSFHILGAKAGVDFVSINTDDREDSDEEDDFYTGDDDNDD